MGSVSDDANDRNLGLFSDLEAPSINDGVVELTFKSSKQDGYVRRLPISMLWPP